MEDKDKEKEISEKKKDSDSTMNAIPEKELLKEEMLKKSTSPPFPQALHGKKGIRNASEILESPLKYKDPGSPTISVMIGGKVFIVLDTDPTVKEANLVPIILGRPFLATSNAIINQTTPEEEEGPEEEGLSEPPNVLATLQSWRRIEEILPLFNKEEEAAA
ncbi:hypothetical protein CK203_065528 [Vitis vinifera]|uniref:Uncharacterized protein n=1 Tax=Vitis vinifera TaxID=29760 RepID=A0A438G3P4_VITVI|nr:hypothetical protein CK203_065528 [Vitis vinifera]